MTAVVDTANLGWSLSGAGLISLAIIFAEASVEYKPRRLEFASVAVTVFIAGWAMFCSTQLHAAPETIWLGLAVAGVAIGGQSYFMFLLEESDKFRK
jgi:uncharacterized membrane protein